MNMTLSVVSRWIFTALGAALVILRPALPYVLICTIAILYDCYTAWSLERRIRTAYPDKAAKDAGKFQSRNFGRVVVTLIKSYSLIILAHLIDIYITGGLLPVDCAKMAAGAICFWQLWSILENESSCNGALWARIAQKILVDKTSRHLDIDLSELNKNENTH